MGKACPVSNLLLCVGFRVPLFNHRGNMKVVLLTDRGDKQKSVLAACPDVIEVQNPHEPLRIQLALTKNPRHGQKIREINLLSFCNHAPVSTFDIADHLVAPGH